jgi:prepilin-type N-terminal cleavage/methylation domain-containing protein
MSGGSDILRYRDQKGLTLIEISVALVIIGISVLAMYIMFINGREMIVEQQHRRVALEQARKLMEDMQYSRMKEGKVPESFRGSDEVVLIPGEDREEITAERTVTVEYSQEINSKTGMPFYSDVRVIYEWEELSGREYRVDLISAF